MVNLSERYGVDDLAALISDSNCPTGVMPHLMEQSTPEFCRCLVSRSLGCQWDGQINTFIVPYEVVFRTKVEEVTRHPSLRVIGTLPPNAGHLGYRRSQ